VADERIARRKPADAKHRWLVWDIGEMAMVNVEQALSMARVAGRRMADFGL
jgi:hypothetical protein